MYYLASQGFQFPIANIAMRGAVRSRRGLGFTNTQMIGGAAAGAAAGITTAIATGSKIEGAIAGGMMAVAPFTGPAAPFLMLAATLVAPLGALINRGCGQTCVATSQYANVTQDAISKLSAAYWAQPVRYRSMQVQTLAYIDQALAWLNQQCENPALGDAGVRCISERLVRGGTAPWCPSADHRGCDYPTSTRDPIANDAAVVPDPSPIDTAASSVLQAAGINPDAAVGSGGAKLKDLLLPAAVLAIGAFLVMGAK